MSVQAPRSVVLIRPRHFHPNPETAADNRFQTRAPGDVSHAAYEASTAVARSLDRAGVTVHVFDDATGAHPDSVFPDNWFSTHAGGRVAVYPMTPPIGAERRSDVIELLEQTYRVQEVVDYSGLESDDLFLAGTGSMVLDHVARVAYTALSRRADPLLLERFCTTFGYEPMVFDATDASGTPIYHTNIIDVHRERVRTRHPRRDFIARSPRRDRRSPGRVRPAGDRALARGDGRVRRETRSSCAEQIAGGSSPSLPARRAA